MTDTIHRRIATTVSDDPDFKTSDTITSRWRKYVGTVPRWACWPWQGSSNSGGYGYYHVGMESSRGVMHYAHRVMFMLYVDSIPDGANIDHICHNPPCVNPDHLRAISPCQNTHHSDTHHAVKDECIRGHPFDSENTYVYTDSRGYEHRQCRECQRRRQEQFHRKRATT